MFERFTDRARRSVVLAQEEPRLLNHNFIGTEHILLGLIREGEGLATKALVALGFDLAEVRRRVLELAQSEGAQGLEKAPAHRPTATASSRLPAGILAAPGA